MKLLSLIMMVILLGCSVTYETRTKLEVQTKEKIDSIQKIKNNHKIPYGWSRYKK